MKLQEQINRINEMMGILSEDKKIEHYQKLIDYCVGILFNRCGQEEDHDFFINEGTCELLSLSLEVKVIGVEKYHEQNVIVVSLIYKSFFDISEDEDMWEFEEDLRKEMSNYISNFTVQIEDIKNLTPRSDRKW